MRAFWILTTGMFATVLALGSVALGAHIPWAWGAVGLCLPLPGLVWPVWFELGVRAWNKGAPRCAAILRAYVLKVSYYVLFGAVSGNGSSLDLARRNGEVSRWIARLPHDNPVDRADPRNSRHGWWGQELMGLARRPANVWMACLVPVLLLLVLLRDETQESAPPSATYTLY